MKRSLTIALALTLLFAACAAASASPVTSTEAGRYIAFGDWDGWWNSYALGVGYGVADGYSIGLMYALDDGVIGIFVSDMVLAPVIVRADIWYNGDYNAKLTSIWTFKLAPFTVGLGAGAEYRPPNGNFFLEADADLALGKNLGLYGSVGYYPTTGNYWYSIGVMLEL